MKAVFAAMATAAFALIAGILVSQPGRAAGLGCHVGILGGMSATNTKTTFDDPNFNFAGGNIATINGLGSNGSQIGLGGGCDVVVDKILLGAFADYVWHNQSFNGSIGGFGGAATLNIDLDRQWTIGGRAGVVISETTLAYLLAGYTNLSTNGLNGAIVAAVPDFNGIVLGGGIETAIGKHVKLGLEYRHTNFDAQTVAWSVSPFPGAPALGFSSTLKPEMDSVFVKLSFGTDFFGPGAK